MLDCDVSFEQYDPSTITLDLTEYCYVQGLEIMSLNVHRNGRFHLIYHFTGLVWHVKTTPSKNVRYICQMFFLQPDGSTINLGFQQVNTGRDIWKAMAYLRPRVLALQKRLHLQLLINPNTP